MHQLELRRYLSKKRYQQYSILSFGIFRQSILDPVIVCFSISHPTSSDTIQIVKVPSSATRTHNGRTDGSRRELWSRRPRPAASEPRDMASRSATRSKPGHAGRSLTSYLATYAKRQAQPNSDCP